MEAVPDDDEAEDLLAEMKAGLCGQFTSNLSVNGDNPSSSMHYRSPECMLGLFWQTAT